MNSIRSIIVAGALFFIICSAMGCATASSYMKTEDRTRMYDASRKEAYDAVIATAADLKWKVENTDPDSGTICLHPPLDFMTSSLANAMQGGDIVEIQLTKIDEQRVRITAEQKSRGELMDWGRAAGNINTFYKKLNRRLKRNN